MDMMEVRRRVMLSMSGKRIYSGTYIPADSVTAYSIDIGVTEWTHFLLVAHNLPYADGTVTNKSFCSEYVDFEQDYCVNTHTSTSTGTSPAQTSFYKSGHSYFPTKNGSVITRGGSVGYFGILYADVQYDWYAW